MSRGKKYPPSPKFYPGCGHMVRVRDGKVMLCDCRSCKQQG